MTHVPATGTRQKESPALKEREGLCAEGVKGPYPSLMGHKPSKPRQCISPMRFLSGLGDEGCVHHSLITRRGEAGFLTPVPSIQ